MRCILLLVPALMLPCGCLDESGSSAGGGAGTRVDPSIAVFDPNEFSDFRLTMAPADWDSIVNDTMGDTYREARVEWKTVAVDRVGVRPSGDWSRFAGNQKMSLKLKFDAFVLDQNFRGMEELKLDGLSRDPSFMRERLSYGIFAEGLVAPRAAHCRLFVNGDYRGVYEVEEWPDDEMVEFHFGGLVGNLYRVRSTTAPSWDPYLWRGSETWRYIPWPWEPDTNRATADHTRVVNFVDVVNHAPLTLESVCDIDALITYLAVEAAIAATDGMAGNYGVENHWQYYRFETQRFTVIPWDVDAAWWLDNVGRSIWQNFQGNRLTAIVELDPDLRSRYKTRIAEVVDAAMKPESIDARIDFIYFQIRDAVYADPYKPGTNDDFDYSRQALKDFAAARSANLKSQLALP